MAAIIYLLFIFYASFVRSRGCNSSASPQCEPVIRVFARILVESIRENFRILNLFTDREPIASQIIFQCCSSKSETQWPGFFFSFFVWNFPVRCQVSRHTCGLGARRHLKLLEPKLQECRCLLVLNARFAFGCIRLQSVFTSVDSSH